MHEGNDQQLYYTFVDVCSIRSRIKLCTIFWNSFITYLLSLILMRNISYYKRQFFNYELTHYFSLGWSETNFSISGFLITVLILSFKDLYMFVLYSLSTILYVLKGKKLKKNIMSRLKIKTIFFIFWQKNCPN